METLQFYFYSSYLQYFSSVQCRRIWCKIMSDVSAPAHIRPWKTCRIMCCKIKEWCECINTHAPVKNCNCIHSLPSWFCITVCIRFIEHNYTGSTFTQNIAKVVNIFIISVLNDLTWFSITLCIGYIQNNYTGSTFTGHIGEVQNIKNCVINDISR